MNDAARRLVCPPLPLWRRVLGPVFAAFRAIRHGLSGKPVLAPTGLSDARLVICRQCPCNTPDFARCSVCSCFVVAKAVLRTERCPQGYW